MDYYAYIYVNEPEIERLYAQHIDWVISERLQSNKKILKGGVSAKVFGTGVDIGGDKEIEYTDKKELSFDHKVKQIKSTLASSNNLFHEIGEAFDILKMGQGIYIDTRMRFIVPQFKAKEALDLVNREGYIILESRINRKLLIMSLGLDNMPRLRTGVMSRNSHDAIFFREIAEKGFIFAIFGFISAINRNKYQIRPITVALP